MRVKKEGMPLTSEPVLEPLNQLVGTWTTEATHPAVLGVVVRGTATFEWLEGERFLIQRTHVDHPAFPDAISIVGLTDRDRIDSASGAAPAVDDQRRLTMHYFDSRGVFRLLEVSVDSDSWRVWRHAPGFSQRFTGTFGEGGDTIVGTWQLCKDDVHWNDDLQISYRRRK